MNRGCFIELTYMSLCNYHNKIAYFVLPFFRVRIKIQQFSSAKKIILGPGEPILLKVLQSRRSLKCFAYFCFSLRFLSWSVMQAQTRQDLTNALTRKFFFVHGLMNLFSSFQLTPGSRENFDSRILRKGKKLLFNLKIFR